MKKAISEQVVVVTGASSGIGRECALQLARRGAKVVAAARSEAALRTLERVVRAAQGQVLTVTADVADWQQVQRLARVAVERFGRIDTWVNNAAVTLYATVADSDVDEMRRIIEVNLLGQIHGIKAALPIMRAQGGGTIINVSAALGWRAAPLQAAYAASKHGIEGFSEALRMELAHEGAGVHVTLIQPGSVNTPLFAHARSKLGVMPRPLLPVYQPSTVANAVLFASENLRRDIVVGGPGKALILAERISPRLTDWYMLWNQRAWTQQMTSIPDDGQDNLFAPSGGPGAVRGSFGQEAREQSLYTRIFELHPWTKAVAVALFALGSAPVMSGVLLAGARNLAAGALESLVRRVSRALVGDP